ncbi:MAG: sensor histidine kinase, partial [Acidimicrobiales bacterium]
MSLRTRLLAAATLLVVSLAVSGFLIVRTADNSALHQVDNQLTATLPIAIGLVRSRPPPAPSPPAPSPPLPTPPLAERTNSLSDTYLARVVDGHRTTLASPRAAKGSTPQTPPVVASAIGSAHPVIVHSVHGSGRWRAILLRTPAGNQVLVAIYLGPVDATASQLRTAVFVAGGVMAIILLAAGFWIERLGLRPITRMRRVAEAVVAGDRKRRVAPGSPGGETSDLASALNSMLDQQYVTEARLRQFVADASHELRTPTAVISGLAQLWRQGELRDGLALEDAMRRIGQESARMKGLVEELLLLARLDEGMPMRHDPVDLAGMVRDVLAGAAANHPSRQITAELDEGFRVPGEPAALRRMVSNLITNALIHTSSPVTVRVTVHA